MRKRRTEEGRDGETNERTNERPTTRRRKGLRHFPASQPRGERTENLFPSLPPFSLSFFLSLLTPIPSHPSLHSLARSSSSLPLALTHTHHPYTHTHTFTSQCPTLATHPTLKSTSPATPSSPVRDISYSLLPFFRLLRVVLLARSFRFLKFGQNFWDGNQKKTTKTRCSCASVILAHASIASDCSSLTRYLLSLSLPLCPHPTIPPSAVINIVVILIINASLTDPVSGPRDRKKVDRYTVVVAEKPKKELVIPKVKYKD